MKEESDRQHMDRDAEESGQPWLRLMTQNGRVPIQKNKTRTECLVIMHSGVRA